MACKNSKRCNCLRRDGASSKLLFGVDSTTPANTLLQNNLDMFEWVRRNKIYPAFWGRNIAGEDALTRDEIAFLKEKVCKIAPIYSPDGETVTYLQGKGCSEEAALRAKELSIPMGRIVFLDLDKQQKITTEFLFGYAETLIAARYVPGFKANTDAKYDFDREFSRGMQMYKEVFSQCFIWATAPILPEYERMTTTHLLHPDEWKPFAPSGVKRKDIAIWQYGNECHPIYDDNDKHTMFNIDLVQNEEIIIEHLY